MAKEKEGAGRPRTGEARFAAYLEGIAAVLGRANRAAAARAYCTGLLLPGERKSVEPVGRTASNAPPAGRPDRARPGAGGPPVAASRRGQGRMGRRGGAAGGAPAGVARDRAARPGAL